jgi:predicted RNase H-like nuclease (RuvC/YqgF family)
MSLGCAGDDLIRPDGTCANCDEQHDGYVRILHSKLSTLQYELSQAQTEVERLNFTIESLEREISTKEHQHDFAIRQAKAELQQLRKVLERVKNVAHYRDIAYINDLEAALSGAPNPEKLE